MILIHDIVDRPYKILLHNLLRKIRFYTDYTHEFKSINKPKLKKIYNSKCSWMYNLVAKDLTRHTTIQHLYYNFSM